MKRVRGPLKSQVASMQNSPDNVSPPEEQKQVETQVATATTTTKLPNQVEEEKKSAIDVVDTQNTPNPSQDNRDRLTQQTILKYLKNWTAKGVVS